MSRVTHLIGLAVLVAARPMAALQIEPEPERVVHAAERAFQDDSLERVSVRWRAALARDSGDRAATLGLATIARQTYDFERAERLFGELRMIAGCVRCGRPATR